MTRILLLANEDAFFSLETRMNAETLLQAVNGDLWQPPPRVLSFLPKDSQGRTLPLRGVQVGSLVVVFPNGFEALQKYAEMPKSKHLSERQRMILQALAEGQSIKAIARTLGISSSTVAGHIAAIKRRLNSRTLAQAILRGSELGLCHPSPSGSGEEWPGETLKRRQNRGTK
jgi:DNA-binding NarL/FixJ family response regulator